MRITHGARCALLLGLGLGLVAFGAAAADAASTASTAEPAPAIAPTPFVTCATPVVTNGSVATSSARAGRGTTMASAAPDETCVTGLVGTLPVSHHGVIDRLRALPASASSTTALAVVAIAAVLIAFGVPAGVGWRTRSRTSEDPDDH